MRKKYFAYRSLQKHLDSHPIGFPASVSGADIRLLKHIFTPEEAMIACCLSHKFEPIDDIFQRAEHLIKSPALLEKALDRIQKKGGIESILKEGKKHYCNAPLVVGFYEMQMERMSPEFLKDFDDYTGEINFGLAFLATARPQMRTIPINKSILPTQNVSTFDEISLLLEQAEGPFVIVPCICRKKKEMEGEPCKITDRKETCLAVGQIAATCIAGEFGREITRKEAFSIIEKNQKDGLVLQPSNTRTLEFLCSCCGCCCGMLTLHQKLPLPMEFRESNFYASVDAVKCNGCGVCAKRCQVGAISFSESKEPKAFIDLDICMGCGVCVPTCPGKAITLVKKSLLTEPPIDRNELHREIMDGKKAFGKTRVALKLLKGVVKKGKTAILK
ncbi:4Fe-4S binding domain protein [Desulfamplus magnetovallimortis]|uniref:4Fe-4S binding domain protein n=1 Tax=Desulfamplus magnetovallimortis TaxID=1246637 RepID=A0A1W1H889_9BACT|nr:4Fe-4S dicluster domain-containing protein [Desulfamplus magnetovallimortis]SLM28595.1 4Fe-4S binding domain protein [Desulfamplus magnetovallimortis]